MCEQKKLLDKLQDNIWFTRLARIEASTRLLNWDLHIQIILLELTFLSLVSSIVGLNSFYINPFAKEYISVYFSLFIFSLALFHSMMNFKNRGESFKNNYIELQKLIFEIENEKCKIAQGQESNRYLQLCERYTELLKVAENHTSEDDLFARSRKDLSTRRLSFNEEITVFIMKKVRIALLTVFYVMPIVFIYSLYVQ